MDKAKGIRAKRTEQVLRPVGAYGYTSGYLFGLVTSARLLLLAAQAERQPNDGENFLTSHAPGAIVLVVTAFETFINEVLHSCWRLSTANKAAFEELVRTDSLTDKFRRIPYLVKGGPELVNEDVALLQHVRNEVVHWYPRPVGKTGVPEWLQPLADRGLLYNDVGWLQKLQSFQLAQWCGQTTSIATQQFADALAAGEQNERLKITASCVRGSARYFRELVV